ncbi:MAG: hypothetical protein ACRC5M_02570 [Anaeroplasmataceae bacterium]
MLGNNGFRKIGVMEKQDMLNKMVEAMAVYKSRNTMNLSNKIGTAMSLTDLHLAKLYWVSVSAMARTAKHTGKNKKTTAHRTLTSDFDYGFAKRVVNMVDNALLIAKEFENMAKAERDIRYINIRLNGELLTEIDRAELERRKASLISITKMYNAKPTIESLELTENENNLIKILKKSANRKR